MIYTDPEIFGNNDTHRALGFLCRLAATPLMEHVAAESGKLTPIFDAAAKALQPYERSNEFSASRLRNIFTDTAATFGFMTYGQPLMIGENLLPTLQNFIRENDIDISYQVVIPDGGKHKDRMFKTATFGFFSLNSQTEKDAYPKKIMCPFYIVPDEFLHNPAAKDLLKEAAQMSYWFNHDYFHQMIYVAFDKGSFAHRHSTAPGESCLLPPGGRDVFGIDPLGPVTRRFETAWDEGKLCRKFRMDTHIEPWAMRFHREVLLQMDDPESVMHKAIDRFIESYAASTLPQAQTKMSDPAIYPQEYAMRLVAFNMVRYAPLHHPAVEAVMQRFSEIADKCPETPIDLKHPRDVFQAIYKTPFTSTFFGCGYNEDAGMRGIYGSPENYTAKVMGASAESLDLVEKDTRSALRIARYTPLKYTMLRGDHTLD